jgi:hypothetical protein
MQYGAPQFAAVPNYAPLQRASTSSYTMQTQVYINICIYILYTYICMYTHTHTHTHTRRWRSSSQLGTAAYVGVAAYTRRWRSSSQLGTAAYVGVAAYTRRWLSSGLPQVSAASIPVRLFTTDIITRALYYAYTSQPAYQSGP